MSKKVTKGPILPKVELEKEEPIEKAEEEKFEEKVIQVDRVSRTVRGGRRIRFRVLVAVGNKNGKVGIGISKASDVLTAVTKGGESAKRHLITVPIIKGTIPSEIISSFGSAKVLLKPARRGTSIIAGQTVKTILELAGVSNAVSKELGSANKINNAKATLIALEKLKKEEKND